MIELPESHTLAKQLTKELQGKKIQKVIAGKSPHGFAFFFGDQNEYDRFLKGKIIEKAEAYGGRVQIEAEGYKIDFHDGVNLRFLNKGVPEPKKHQLYILFDDESALSATVQMYGGLMVFKEGENENFYYIVAHEKISPLQDEFDMNYFYDLLQSVDQKKVSAKAFLATEQRIPGLGNGALQDILWTAKIHPKRKMADLSKLEVEELYFAVKSVLKEMAERGGRDTEKDLYGNLGGYQTVMSKNNKAMLCPICGEGIQKGTYLGGNVYVCPSCQRL